MKQAVIVSAVRTPIGNFNGSLGTIGATQLGAVVIEAAVERAHINKEAVNEVVMGMVLPCGYGQNPARQAAIKAGMPWEVECITINKVCGSSLKSVMLAAQAIQVGDADVVVAGGMESMSMAPYYLEKARFGYRMGPGNIEDHMIHDGIWDIVNDFHMGITNELSSEKYNISRQDQDYYAAESYSRTLFHLSFYHHGYSFTAAESYSRTLEAIRSGRFKDEIVPVKIPRRKGDPVVFDQDECPRETSLETLSKMKPAFQKYGKGTAGNSSIVSDGAAAVVVMSKDRAKEMGCNIIANIGAQAAYGVDLKDLLTAPIWAIPKCLKKEGISIDEVDLFEINEAFSGSTVAVLRELGLDHTKVNVNGGSVALGHPIGASGCRVLVTLLHEMMRQDKKIGVASLCLGGGEAVAMVVKR